MSNNAVLSIISIGFIVLSDTKAQIRDGMTHIIPTAEISDLCPGFCLFPNAKALSFCVSPSAIFEPSFYYLIVTGRLES